METSTLTKIKNGSITLPKTLKESWRGKEVYMRFGNDTIFIQKVQPPSFWEVREQLKTVAKSITQKDIDAAVKWVRRKRARAAA